MKKIVSIILSGLTLASCVDTVLLPDNKTVEEDFWQTKSDVNQMVTGAYVSMISKNLQERFVVWTSRSDEMNVNSALNNSNLNQINSANILSTNAYCSWGDLYSVINSCNLVISKSADVMNIDPNYMEGDHYNNIAQMKALRSLCYFYLIRVFRDVPLILEPYKLSSQDMSVYQVAPSVVLEQIIADLEEVKDYTLSSQNVTGAARNATFTRDGVYALLADVYLWKASVFNDDKAYSRCIECCNVIRNNRKAAARPNNFGPTGSALDDDGFDLNTYNNYFNLFYNGGHDQESLFELSHTNNEGLCVVYNKYKDKINGQQPQFFASNVYAKAVAGDNYVFNHDNYKNDVRGFESIYGFNGVADDGFTIRKFVAQTSNVMGYATELKAENYVERAYGTYQQNWVIYRVTDVMLMKAEALVQRARILAEANSGLVDELQLATTPEDSLAVLDRLAEVNQTVASYNIEAARQVQIVNTRARIDEKSQIDSASYKIPEITYPSVPLSVYATSQLAIYSGFTGSINKLEQEVMNERARELCFEGKRWFDMLRYNYRHTTGVNYNVILAQQGGNFAKNYDEMLKLIARKYTSGGGTGITSKMPTEPYLYMPIIQSEMDVNPNLQQNPVYSDNNTIDKNY